MRGASRSRVVSFSLSLALAAISLPACKNKAEVEAAKASANQALADLKIQVGNLQTGASGLRARFQALPEDLPDLEPVHSMLFSIEEVLGVEGARVKWLSGELDTAVGTGKREQIQKVSDMTRGAIEGNKQIEKAIIKLMHQLLPFEGMAARRRALTSKPPEARPRADR